MPSRSNVSLWWNEPKELVHRAVHETVNAIRTHQAQRIDDIHFLWGLYGARPENLYGVTHIISEDLEGAPPLPINVVSQVVDGFTAKIAKARPRVLHVPVGGDYQTRRKAEERTNFVDGCWYATKLRESARLVALEAAISGTGILKAYAEDGEIKHEVVPPEELWVDHLDARYGSPRSLYQRRYVDRAILQALYPKKKSAIAEASDGADWQENHYPGYATQADQVLVTEAWHLPSSKTAGDGRHVIAIDTAALVDEPWTWDRFPFAVLRFTPTRGGFWASGLVDDVYGIQSAISDLMEQVLVGLREAKARILLERGSKVNPADFTDDLGADIIEYTGRPPVVVVPQAVPGEVYQMIWDLVSRAFQQVGLSEMITQALKPAGMTSGVALRTYSDIESSRHVLPGYAFEDWHLDVADLDLRVAAELAKSKEGYSVLYVGRKYGRHEAKRIKFWEPSDGEEYILRAYPTSLLPETPAGKLAMIGELESRGYLTPEESMDLLDLPDLDRALTNKTAGLRTVLWYLDRMVSEGIYSPPEPFLPLQLALTLARDTYLTGQQDGIPEDRLDLIRDWMDACASLLEPPAPPPGLPPGPMAPEAPPPEAPPGQPPIDQMVPQ